MPAQTLAEQGSTYILDYGVVGVFLVLGAVFAALFMILGVVFRPKKPSTSTAVASQSRRKTKVSFAAKVIHAK